MNDLDDKIAEIVDLPVTGYSSTVGLALEALDAMFQKGWSYGMDRYSWISEGKYWVRIWRLESKKLHYAISHQFLPMAICLAIIGADRKWGRYLDERTTTKNAEDEETEEGLEVDPD